MTRILCALLICSAGLRVAEAHQLTVDWSCDGATLEIQARSGTEPASGARIQLRDASDESIAGGVLDDSGHYHWPLSGAPPITIEIDAGLGHRASLTLTEKELKPGSTPGAPGEARARSGGSSDTRFTQTVRVLVGLTFCLALAAAVMSYRNSRRLADLERHFDRHEG